MQGVCVGAIQNSYLFALLLLLSWQCWSCLFIAIHCFQKMTLETHPAAEALQLDHSAYSKDFDVKIIPVLASLKRGMSWWSGYHYRCMWMCDVYVLLLQQWLQHKATQHVHGRSWGQSASRAPQPNFWAGYLDLWHVQTGMSVFSFRGNTFVVTVLLTDHARSLKPSSVTPIHFSSLIHFHLICDN